MLNRAPRRVVIALAGALAASCSLIVHPDETRLGQVDGGVNGDGVSMVDVTFDSTPADNRIPTDTVATDNPPPSDHVIACATNCNDMVACTNDRCDTTTGACVHMPDATHCAAGQVCDATQGCMTRPCTGDSDCMHHDMCTGAEHCQMGHCVAAPPLHCDDGMFCNGIETCDPARGCLPAMPPACDDGNMCTMDRCDPAAPSVTSGQTGGCTHMLFSGPGCMASNQTCATAIPITLSAGSVSAMGSNVGSANMVNSQICGGMGAEVWYAITSPANTDLRVEALPDGMGDPVLEVRDSCAAAADLVCNDDYSFSTRASRVWLRGEAGATAMRTVYVAVDAYMPGVESTFTLNVAVSPVVAPVTSCASTGFVLDAGGAVYGKLPRRVGFTQSSCARFPTPLDFYQYNGAAGQTRVTAYSRSFNPTVFIREDCPSGNDVFCQTNQFVQTRYRFASGNGPADFFVANGPLAGGTTNYVFELVVP